MSEVMTVLKSLGDEVKKIKETNDSFATEIKSLKEKAPGQVDPARVFSIRHGENPLTSRPYSFVKAVGLYSRKLTAEECKVEIEISDKLQKNFKDHEGKKSADNSLMIPFWSAAIGGDDPALAEEVRTRVKSMGGVDPDEVRHIAKAAGYTKDLSWLTDTAGGTLVPLPQQGELIELLRNQEVLMQAGAAQFPLPPQGRLVLPKQTGAMTAYWLGETATITKSDITTSSVTLQAKKLAVRGSIPNELFRYSNPAADAIVRADIARVLSLKMDNAGLEGVASAVAPGGIINYAGINTHTASTTGSNGDTYEPQDPSKQVGTVEAVNGIINDGSCAFITRPKLFRAVNVRRAEAVTTDSFKGSFVQFGRAMEPAAEKRWCGYPVVLSNQVSGARVKSGGTTLTYVIFGDWSQWLIGMGGVMELDLNPWGDTPWSTDQTEMRGILPCDMAPRHVESFSLCDVLVQA